MKLRFALVLVCILTLGCQVTYMPQRDLSYAELVPQSAKETSKLLLKMENNHEYSYDLFVVTVYQLKIISTGKHKTPFLNIRFKINNQNTSEHIRIEYAELDLPNINELQRWRNAIDKNEPIILYPPLETK